MRERLPKVGAVFQSGDIDYLAFQTIVYRTDLIIDDEILAAVDAELAVKVTRWPSMSRGRLGAIAKGLGQGPDQLAQGGPHVGGSRRRPRHQK